MAGLARQHLFQGVDPVEVTRALSTRAVRTLAPGEVLIAQGAPNRHIYLLLEGSLWVQLDGGTERIPVAAGDCVGEMSVIDQGPASASVIADTAASVIAIEADAFWDTFAALPRVAQNLMRMLTQRIRRHNEQTLAAQAQALKLSQLERDLNLAREIQFSMLPDMEELRAADARVSVTAYMEPAKAVGGDFYDAFSLGQHRLCFAIGDVSGKGMPAALFMVRVGSLLHARLSEPRRPLVDKMTLLNRSLCDGNDACMFVTLCVGILDKRTGEVEICIAGHPPPIAVTRSGEIYNLAVERSPMLGLKPTALYKTARHVLAPEDRLFVYTDGVSEAERSDNALFGEERIVAALQAAQTETGAAALISGMKAAIVDYVAGHPQSDDITMLALSVQARG